MLSYVSGEKSKDRTDRTFVTPWFRFLWETYRNLLDILRHNSRLEALYALTITRTFEFCFKYKRQSEFRRLCELLRSHLTNIQRRALYGKDQRDRPDLTNPETLQLHVDTRFEQLKVILVFISVQLERLITAQVTCPELFCCIMVIGCLQT